MGKNINCAGDSGDLFRNFQVYPDYRLFFRNLSLRFNVIILILIPVQHEVGGGILMAQVWMVLLDVLLGAAHHHTVILPLQEVARGSPKLQQVVHLAPVYILLEFESVVDHVVDNSVLGSPHPGCRPGGGSARAQLHPSKDCTH